PKKERKKEQDAYQRTMQPLITELQALSPILQETMETRVAVSPDGQRFAAIRAVPTAPLKEQKGRRLGALARAMPGIAGEIAQRASRSAAQSSEPTTRKYELGIYDSRTRERLVVIPSPQSTTVEAGEDVVFSPDGRYIAAGAISRSKTNSTSKNAVK